MKTWFKNGRGRSLSIKNYQAEFYEYSTSGPRSLTYDDLSNPLNMGTDTWGYAISITWSIKVLVLACALQMLFKFWMFFFMISYCDELLSSAQIQSCVPLINMATGVCEATSDPENQMQILSWIVCGSGGWLTKILYDGFLSKRTKQAKSQSKCKTMWLY